MRARIGTVLSLALVFGLLTPGAADRPLAADTDTDGGRAASLGAGIATLPAAAPVTSAQLIILAMGPPALPTVAGPTMNAAAEAEPTPEAERLLKELLHTDRLISVLRPKVFRSGNSAAQEHFGDAIGREQEARQAYDLRLYARASRLTREARSLARESAVMVGPPEEDPVYVSRAIEHARDALRLADGLQPAS